MSHEPQTDADLASMIEPCPECQSTKVQIERSSRLVGRTVVTRYLLTCQNCGHHWQRAPVSDVQTR